MQVLILTAGESKRLRPLTDKHPKSLLKISDKEILHHILDTCQACGLKKFSLLTGHGHEHVVAFSEKYKKNNPDVSIEIIYNNEYNSKGNIHSLYSAKPIFSNDFIIINSDTIFHKNILQALLDHPQKNVMAIDDFKKLSDEEMKVYIDKDNKIHKIHKTLKPEIANGEYIGLMKLGSEFKQALINSLETVMQNDPSLYYEDALQHFIDQDAPIYKISTSGLPAMEIDTHEDLKNAKQLIQQIIP
ncbi:MAG: phosphocholine cytidylyltransferase family protein [Patescibacteria group bacterium]